MRKGTPAVVNALTFDVEGFAESNVESFAVPQEFLDPTARDREIVENTRVVLDLLRRRGVRATFFVLGRIARDTPAVVADIAHEGHELACHSLEHQRITDPERFRDDLREATGLLRQAGGVDPTGFRAPDFSITPRTLWALDVIHAEGYHYDSSIVPTSIHDVYGLTGAARFPHRLPGGLVEIPLSVLPLPFGIPVAGGGYFRLFPFALTRWAIRTLNRRGSPAVIYLHPYEIGSCYPRIGGLTSWRRFRHYVGIERGLERLDRLLDEFQFGTAGELAARVR